LTSAIRAFDLAPKHYESIEHFFKASSWSSADITNCWTEQVLETAPLYVEDDAIILVMDGKKNPKEGRRMPGVKKLHQESENSGKGKFIHGHMWGSVGILAGNEEKIFSIPLSMRIHDGVKHVFEDEIRKESHVVQMICQTHEAAVLSGRKSIGLGDRYFLCVPVLRKMDELIEKHQTDFHFVSKAKKSVVAYTLPEPPKEKQRGRPRKKGERIKLMPLFEEKASEFKEAEVMI
jgi:hypothetical protein